MDTSFEDKVALVTGGASGIGLATAGRVRAIGVCNFNANHLRDLIAETDVVPAVNQIELHPLFSQGELREINASLGIVTQAWSPIGGTFTNHPHDPGAVTRVLELPVLKRLAEKIGKTPAQVVLRWHFQNGVPAIPKSVNADRIASNIDIFGFELAVTTWPPSTHSIPANAMVQTLMFSTLAFLKARQQQAKK